jgi:cytochrome P450
MGTEFRKAPFYKRLQLNGTLVCLTNIKEHATRRRAFARAFSQGSLMGWENVITSRIRNVINGIRDAGKGGKEVDILEAFSRMASGIIGELVLGGNDVSCDRKFRENYLLTQ